MEPVVHADLRERRRRQTRQEISECALALFEERGVHHTTVDDIAHVAGVSPRTFFRHFATKEDSVLSAQQAFDTAISEWLDRNGDATVVDLPVPANRTELLRQIESEFEAVIDELGDVGEHLLRERRLVFGEPTVRAAALRNGDRNRCEFATRLAAMVPDLGVHEALLILDVAAVVLRNAFDEWSGLLDAGTPSDLAAVYRATRERVRSTIVGSS